MTEERFVFLDLKPIEGGTFSFEGMGKGKNMGIGKIGIPSLASIDNVLHVESLKYNLLTISQFCNSGYIVSFSKDQCIVKTDNGKSFFIARRHSNLYEIDIIGLSKQHVKCLLSKEDERWFWHK